MYHTNNFHLYFAKINVPRKYVYNLHNINYKFEGVRTCWGENKCICVQKFRFHSSPRPDEHPCRLVGPSSSAPPEKLSYWLTGSCRLMGPSSSSAWQMFMSAHPPVIFRRNTKLYVGLPTLRPSPPDERSCWLAVLHWWQRVYSSLLLLWDWWGQDPANTENRHAFGMSLKIIAKSCVQEKIRSKFLALDINPWYFLNFQFGSWKVVIWTIFRRRSIFEKFAVLEVIFNGYMPLSRPANGRLLVFTPSHITYSIFHIFLILL